VVVRVEAVGVNHIDLANRAGGAGSFTAVLGSDAAGRREDTGKRVLVTHADGTYADRVVTKEENLFAIPDSWARPQARRSAPRT
jgi:NADPH:quinone reductase-like Zn-dependent oxidoreductase